MSLLLLVLACGRDALDSDPGLEVEQVPVACAAPGDRASGPLELIDGGASWREDQGHASEAQGFLHAGGVVVEDFDGDGRPDLYLTGVDGGELFIAQADGSYVEESQTRLLGMVGEFQGVSTAASALDIDSDGDVDLFLCRMSGPNHLLLNNGAGILERAEVAFPDQVRTCTGASWGDMDGDEDLDLFVSAAHPCDAEHVGAEDPADCGEGWADAPPTALFENRGDLEFVDVSERLGAPDLAWGQTHISAWLDLDLDGDLDLYIVNDRMRQVDFMPHNEAWLNDGAGNFERMADGSGLDIDLEGMGLGVGDLNGDLLPDVLVSGTHRLALLLSAPDGTWIDSSASRGLEVPYEGPRADAWGNELADLDNDGDLDAVAVFGWNDGTTEDVREQADGLWLQADDGQFEDSAAAWGFDHSGVGRGLVVTDLNGDGWLDLVSRYFWEPARVHLARCGEAAWLTVDLEQDGPNVDALGARIELEAGGETQVRWLASATGLFGSGPPVAHFGLGERDAVDALRVVWPDGEVSELGAFDARQHLTVRR